MSSPIAPETRAPQQAPAPETRAPQLAAVVAVVLAVLALALVADRFLAHGATVTWRSPEHDRVVVARTLEHRASFPSMHRPLSRYAQHWDFARFGVPPAVPRLDALVEADLTVPAGETRALPRGSARLALRGYSQARQALHSRQFSLAGSQAPAWERAEK